MRKLISFGYIYILLPLCFLTAMQPALAENKLYIGVQPRNLPYMSHDGGDVVEGMLVDKMRMLCHEIKANCIFHTSGPDKLLKELQYGRLDAVILSDQFIADEQARGLFFFPAFCTVTPAFIWGKYIDPVVEKDTFMYQSVGVLENSYLEFYLQNHFPLNIQIVPYDLMENAVFDLLNDKIDVLFSSISFFEARVKNVFTEGGVYHLPSVAAPIDNYPQPEHIMRLVSRDSHPTLKQKLLDILQQQEAGSCADLLQDYFESNGLINTQ